MSRIRCPKCKGTGIEPCEVHGSHPCKRCNGKGCINGGWDNSPWFPNPNPVRPTTYPPWIVTCQSAKHRGDIPKNE